MPQTSNQSIESVAETSFIGVHSSPQMSNQPEESISETSFIGAHSLPQKQEEPVDIPTEQIDFIEPPNDQRLTKTDYCKEVTTGAPLPPFYNEVKLFLKSKKSTRGLSSKRDNMQSVRNDDHRLNRPGIRPHLNRIAHPDAESKRISLSTQGKKSSSRSIFDLSPSKSKSSHEHKKLKPEKHTARKSDVKSRQNGSSHKSIDKSKLLPEKSKLKLETKRNSARVEDESTPMQNKDFDNNGLFSFRSFLFQILNKIVYSVCIQQQRLPLAAKIQSHCFRQVMKFRSSHRVLINKVKTKQKLK